MASQQGDLYKLLNVDNIGAAIVNRFPDLCITESDIKFPTQDVVTKIYLAYLETIGIVLPCSLRDDQIPLYPEAFPEILVVSSLRYTLDVVLKANCFFNFSELDIVHPTPERTSYILAILDNFVMFCEHFVIDLESKLVTLEDQKARYVSCLQRKEQLRRELNERAVNRAKKETILKNNSLVSEQKRIILEQWNANKKKLLEQEYKLNSHFQSVKQEIAVESKKVHDLDEKIDSLKKKVVFDYEFIMNQSELLKEEFKQKKEEIKTKTNFISLKKIGLERYNFVVETQQQQANMLKELKHKQGLLLKETANVNSKESELMILTQEVNSSQELISKEIKGNQLKEQNLSLELKLSNKDAQLTKSIMVANEERDQVKRKLDEAHGCSTDIDKQLLKCQNEFENILEVGCKVAQHAENRNSEACSEHQTFCTDLLTLLGTLRMNILDISSAESEKENNNQENILKKP